MRIHYRLLTALIFATLQIAIYGAIPYSLIVTMVDGTTHEISLSSYPVINVGEEFTTISSPGSTLCYNTQNISTFKYDIDNGVQDAIHDIRYRIEGTLISINSQSEPLSASIYDLNGMLLGNFSTTAGQKLKIDLSTYVSGIYIVKINDFAIKIRII